MIHIEGDRINPLDVRAQQSSGSPAGSSAPAAPANVQEFVIRVPKTNKKKHHVMRFNATLNVDFAQWKAVKMERDLALQNNRQMEEEIPKFGAGSEYNRDLKEELRRKRFGINPKKFKPEAQPWILKTGKNGKKFRGIREGGVGENAAFYVFTHAPDKAIEAYPLHEWYNFQPIQRYKSLSAEEAEAEFGRRKKVINYFSLMLRKRLKGDDADDVLEEAGDDKKPGKGKAKAKELKISDMDEWIDSDDDDSDGSDKEGDKEKGSDNEEADKKKKKGKKEEEEKKKKKKKRDVDDEAFEESDDGDEEGRELDYISESSDAVSDLETQVDKEMKGVAEEDALRKLLTSDEDSDEEREKSNDEDEEKEEQQQKEKEQREKKKKKPKKAVKGEKKDSSSDFSTDSDSDAEQPEKKKAKKKETPSASRSASPGPEASSSSQKRKGQGSSLPSDLTTPDSSNSPVNTPAKKPKMDTVSLPASFSGVVSSSKEDYGITEEAVRRYLARKPMTTTELLTKFKNKKTGVSSEKLVDTMTQILKRINPVRQTIMGKMYLSIKADK